MNLYGALTWIYRRIGQMTCFLVSGIAMFQVVTIGPEALPSAIVSAAFLAGGLFLRHQHLTQGPR